MTIKEFKKIKEEPLVISFKEERPNNNFGIHLLMREMEGKIITPDMQGPDKKVWEKRHERDIIIKEKTVYFLTIKTEFHTFFIDRHWVAPVNESEDYNLLMLKESSTKVAKVS